MAEHQKVAEKALQKLTDNLTCPICLDTFQEPKVISCLHAFCTACLERLVSKDGTSLTCPTCRRSTPLLQEGVAGLPSAFYIHHLFDVQDTLEKLSKSRIQCEKCELHDATNYCRDCGAFVCPDCIETHKKWKDFSGHEIVSLDKVKGEAVNLVPTKKVTLTCYKHPSKTLEIYCETCNELICHNCTVRAHREHEFDLVVDCFPKHKEILSSSLQPVKEQLDIVKKTGAKLNADGKRLSDQALSTKQRIHKSIDQLHKALEARKHVLIQQVDDVVRKGEKQLEIQTEVCELRLSQLSRCLEFAEQAMRTGTCEEVLSIKGQILQRVDEVTRSINQDQTKSEQQVAEATLYFKYEPSDIACQDFGEIGTTFLRPEKSYITGEAICGSTAGRETSIVLHVEWADGQRCKDVQAEISGELISRNDGSIIHCRVTRVYKPAHTPLRQRQSVLISSSEWKGGSCDNLLELKDEETEHLPIQIKDNSYKLQYTPTCQGPHDLHIRVYGIPIGGSPFPVPILGFQGAHVRTIQGVGKPVELVVDDTGQVFVVSSEANCVFVLDCEGHKIMSLGNSSPAIEERLERPRGIALCDGGKSVVVTAANCVKKYSLSGQFLASTPSDSGEGALDNPWGIACDSTSGKIYVCDSHNHRIQILNSDLTLSSTLGKKGSSRGEFETPYGITIGPQGNLYIAELGNNRIQVFTADGEFIREFYKRIRSLQGPVSVATNNGFLYVLEYAISQVSVFDKEGSYVTSYFGRIGERVGEFKKPHGISFDREGRMYISDTHNNRLQIFK